MGQPGFCENLRVSAVFPQKSAVFCENLRLRNAVIPKKSENQSVRELRIKLRLSHLVCPF